MSKSSNEIDFSNNLDILYQDYLKTREFDKFRQIIEISNPYLFALIYSFEFDDKVVEDILDELFNRIQENENMINNNESIFFNLYRIGKDLIKEKRDERRIK